MKTGKSISMCSYAHPMSLILMQVFNYSGSRKSFKLFSVKTQKGLPVQLDSWNECIIFSLGCLFIYRPWSHCWRIFCSNFNPNFRNFSPQAQYSFEDRRIIWIALKSTHCRWYWLKYVYLKRNWKDNLRLSDNVAGVTLVALGNGAPDIFSAIVRV